MFAANIPENLYRFGLILSVFSIRTAVTGARANCFQHDFVGSLLTIVFADTTGQSLRLDSSSFKILKTVVQFSGGLLIRI